MSNPSPIDAKLSALSEELEESEEVGATDDSMAVLTLFDGSSARISHSDCCKFFATVGTVRKFCDLIPHPDETTLELHSLTLPEEALFELEDRLMTIEEK